MPTQPEAKVLRPRIPPKVFIAEGARIYGAVEIRRGASIWFNAAIRGCRIGSRTMVGMHAAIMNNAEIGEDSIIGTQAMVAYNKKFPPRSLILGIPAKLVRELSDEDLAVGQKAVAIYPDLVRRYPGKEILGHRD